MGNGALLTLPTRMTIHIDYQQLCPQIVNLPIRTKDDLCVMGHEATRIQDLCYTLTREVKWTCQHIIKDMTRRPFSKHGRAIHSLSMNQELYMDYIRWIRRREMRKDADEWRQQLIKITAKQFEVEGTMLYKK